MQIDLWKRSPRVYLNWVCQRGEHKNKFKPLRKKKDKRLQGGDPEQALQNFRTLPPAVCDRVAQTVFGSCPPFGARSKDDGAMNFLTEEQILVRLLSAQFDSLNQSGKTRYMISGHA